MMHLCDLNRGIQWNLFIKDTLGPTIPGSILLLYRGFPLSDVKMYKHGTIGTAKLVLNREVFCIVSLIPRVL